MQLLIVANFFAQLAMGEDQKQVEERPPVSKSPLTAVDPPELHFLRNSPMRIETTTSINYNNLHYLLNWAGGMLFPGNRRYWFTFGYDDVSNGMIYIKPNMSACVYDVTNNEHFQRLKKIRSTSAETILLLLECAPGDCNEEDVGCGRSPFPWIKLLAGLLLLFAAVCFFLCRNGAMIHNYVKGKMTKRVPVETRGDVY